MLYPLLCCMGVVFLIAAIVALLFAVVKKNLLLALLAGLPLLCIGCSLVTGVAYFWYRDDGSVPDDLSSLTDFDNLYDGSDDDTDDSDDDTGDDYTDLDTDDVVGDGYVTNDEYGFSIFVGAYDNGVFESSSLTGTVENLSYCIPSSEAAYVIDPCDDGYFPAFDITVMTWDQWADHISEDTMGFDIYTKVGDDADYVYLFSHINGDYPGDVPSSDDFFDEVIASFAAEE